jgi:predicted Zn-dependent protease
VADPGAAHPARAAFFGLADRLTTAAREGEVVTASLRGEDSDFARLSRRRVRQAGHVSERELSLTLTAGSRQASSTLDLTGDPEEDHRLADEVLAGLRTVLPLLPEDPYVHLPGSVTQSDDARAGDLPPSAEALGDLLALSEGLDLAGLGAAGTVLRGQASSLGHRHWFQRSSFQLDWSCHLPGNRAVKATQAGERWDGQTLARRVEEGRRELEVLARPPRTLTPGRYRAYLAPAALQALFQLLAWGGFGLKARNTRQTPLLRMLETDERLDPRVTLTEDSTLGHGPRFTRLGFVRPPRVPLVSAGALGEALAGARSAREYGVPVNADEEAPESLVMDPGDLAAADALRALDSGLYVSHLWYCNFSDRNAGRITGMTRYACLWVEHGRPVAPVAPMRFDDTIFNLLGTGLLALTRDRELRVEDSTYEGRSTAAMVLPGALVEGLRLTL